MGSTPSELKPLFELAYDESRILWLVSELQKKNQHESLQLLGDGVHFLSYAWQRPDFSLVIKLGKPTEMSLAHPRLADWRRAIDHLRTLDLALVPPMRRLLVQEQDILVMPMGEPVSREQFTALRPSIEATKKALAREQLLLDDYWQIVTCRNIPFICDWSDLYFPT